MPEDKFLKKLGERIVQLRQERGLKQIDLARNLEIEDSSLRRIESGRTNSSINMLRRIAHELDVTLSQLLDFKY